MSLNSSSNDIEHTRDRLLQAAVRVFAERGFRDATVREICTLASVNVASVNYYFRSKDVLYAEAVAHAFAVAERKYPSDYMNDTSLPPAELLRLFVHSMLQRLMDESELGWHWKLITREIADPTEALDQVVAPVIQPRFRWLAGLIPRIVETPLEQDDIDRLAQCIIGQCLGYRHSRALIDRLCPDIIDGEEAVTRTADLITQFSLAALTSPSLTQKVSQ